MAKKHLRGGGQILKRRLGEKGALGYLKRQICFTSSSLVEKMSKIKVRNIQVVAAGQMQRFSLRVQKPQFSI